MKRIGRSILVVDDDETNRLVVQFLMEMRGFEVFQADSGKACLDMAAEHKFDAILMDLSMPAMDGFETVRRLKSTAGPNILTAIYALTAHTTQEHVQLCQQAGMVSLIAKPFDSSSADQLADFLLAPEKNLLN